MVTNKKPWVSMVPITLYGLSMVATGFFSAAPFEEGMTYSQKEEDLHSVFANVAGIALMAAILSNVILEDETQKRIANISALAFVALSSAMFKIDAERQGVYQRVLWAGSLAWLTFSFSS
jgi:hypothetical protein